MTPPLRFLTDARVVAWWTSSATYLLVLFLRAARWWCPQDFDNSIVSPRGVLSTCIGRPLPEPIKIGSFLGGYSLIIRSWCRTICVLSVTMVWVAACGDGPSSPTPRATTLAFLAQPATFDGGIPASPDIQVVVLDQFGERDRTSTIAVTIALEPGAHSGTIGGTTTVKAVAGVATFDDIRVDRPGTGYRWIASAPGLGDGISNGFDVQLRFAKVASGRSHTCGLTVPGAVYCWGANDAGQVGDGTRASRNVATLVSGHIRFADIDTRAFHTCGLALSGATYCWGHNLMGQVGDGSGTDRDVPTQVAGGLAFSRLAAGFAHSCGVTSSGDAYCWGWNSLGQHGDGSGENQLTPVKVAGTTGFSTIAAGGIHTCAVSMGGTPYCWGWNRSGELGDGTTEARITPVPVTGALSISGISANPGRDDEGYTCAAAPDGRVFCWGTSYSGGLGIGANGPEPSPVEVAGVSGAGSVSAGRNHSCAVTAGFTLMCWGANDFGQLGDGSFNYHSVPVQVSGALSFTQVSAGFEHTCAVTSSHQAYCWGSNEAGQLGDGTSGQRHLPALVK